MSALKKDAIKMLEVIYPYSGSEAGITYALHGVDLTDRNKAIFSRYVCSRESLKEVGDSFCISTQRVSQIIHKAIKRIRKHHDWIFD